MRPSGDARPAKATEVKCPFISRQDAQANDPKQPQTPLELQVLKQPSYLECDYAKECATLDLAAVKQDLKTSQDCRPADYGHYGPLLDTPCLAQRGLDEKEACQPLSSKSQTQHSDTLPNVFIVGAGRSGSSLLASLFADAGFTGCNSTECDMLPPSLVQKHAHVFPDCLYASYSGNLRGNFENRAMNLVNEELIMQSLSDFKLPTPPAQECWLAQVPLEICIEMPTTEELGKAMRALMAGGPFCLKDPRLSYTLPAWISVAPSAAHVLCSFRNPLQSARSFLKEVTLEHNPESVLSFEGAVSLWMLQYRHVLRVQEGLPATPPRVRFVHMMQILDHSLRPTLESLFPDARFDLGAVDPAQVSEEPSMEETRAAVGEDAVSLYQELCRRAGVKLHAVTPGVASSL